MLISPTASAVAKRPVLQKAGIQPSATNKVRFGHDEKDGCCNTPSTPPAAPKPGGSKAIHWVLTALLGAGVAGNTLHNHKTTQKIDDLNKQVAAVSQRTSMDQLLQVVETVTPSTVRVEGSRGLGSGVIIQDNQGRLFILTNGHVTEGNEHRRNQKDGVYHIKLYNGSDLEKPIEFDAAPVMLSNGTRAESSPYVHDLALLQIPADVVLPESVKPVQMRDVTKDPLKVGEVVVAVGNPYGNRDTVSSGIISHIERSFDLEPANRFIQTDTPINPGNSGGGLFDMQGRLVGINTLGYRGADGLGGSIRIDVVKSVLEGWGLKVLAPGETRLELPPAPPRNPFLREQAAPEKKQPEDKAPSEKAPEGKAPEEKAPESKTPEEGEKK